MLSLEIVGEGNKKKLANKCVLLRVDWNVPLKKSPGGYLMVADDTKIVSSIGILRLLRSVTSKIVILTHLGRPETSESDLSTKVIVDYFNKKYSPLRMKFFNFTETSEHNFVNKEVERLDKIGDFDFYMVENTRFFGSRELKNDLSLAQHFLAFSDVLIFEAFAVIHRSHASVVGIIKLAKEIFLGPAFNLERKHLDKIKFAPTRPFISLIGGAKCSDKTRLLTHMMKICDYLLVGGGIANTFLKISGIFVGNSLVEKDPEIIDELSELFKKNKKKIILPLDGIVLNRKSGNVRTVVYSEDNLNKDEEILDIGLDTVKSFKYLIFLASTIFWNGPLGKFEDKRFSKGTFMVAKLIASNNEAYTLVGGGESAYAINILKLQKSFNYVASGGGASLAYLTPKLLPAIKALEEKKRTGN